MRWRIIHSFWCVSSDQNLWLKRDAVEDIAKSFGIDIVDIVLTGTLQEAIDFCKDKPKSHIGAANMEGLVCRPAVEMLDRMGRRVITKLKFVIFQNKMKKRIRRV